MSNDQIEILLQSGDFASLEALQSDPSIPRWMKAQLPGRIQAAKSQKEQQAILEQNTARDAQNQSINNKVWANNPGLKQQMDATVAAQNAANSKGITGGTDYSNPIFSSGYAPPVTPQPAQATTPYQAPQAPIAQPMAQPMAQSFGQPMTRTTRTGPITHRFSAMNTQSTMRPVQPKMPTYRPYRSPQAPSIVPSTYQSRAPGF